MNLEIFREIIKIGTENNGSLVDPSQNEFFKKSGVAMVTAHLEKLSLFGLFKTHRQSLVKMVACG